MDKIAVVILNWNGRELLKKFLPSVISYSEADGGAVYVADNGSNDDSVSLLKKDFPTVRLILFDQNYGFAEGYNRALAQVKAQYVVLLNSDVEVTEHWLLPLASYLDKHPDVVACQPKLLSWHSRNYFEYAGACGGYLDKYGYPYCRGRILNTIEKDDGQYDEVTPVLWATGAALFIRLADYLESGGLDARFFAHMEEVDLCWRLRSRRKNIVCVPQSEVYHVGGGTLNKENPRKTFLNFRNNLLMLYKNLPEKELKPVLRLRAILDYVAALSFALKGEFRSALAVYKARKAYHQLKPEFKDARFENLQKAVQIDIPERMDGSILVKYYLLFKKRFSQLR